MDGNLKDKKQEPRGRDEGRSRERDCNREEKALEGPNAGLSPLSPAMVQDGSDHR